MLHCLQDEDPASPAAQVTAPEEETDDRPAFLCAWCETEIAHRQALFAMRSSSYVQVFPNPLGQMKVIYTFRTARSVSIRSRATGDFTWFEGYAWSIAVCGACGTHLGWLFESQAGAEPASFFGLLKEALVEKDVKGL